MANTKKSCLKGDSYLNFWNSYTCILEFLHFLEHISLNGILTHYVLYYFQPIYISREDDVLIKNTSSKSMMTRRIVVYHWYSHGKQKQAPELLWVALFFSNKVKFLFDHHAFIFKTSYSLLERSKSICFSVTCELVCMRHKGAEWRGSSRKITTEFFR